MTKKKQPSVILTIGGKKKKFKLPEPKLNIYIGLLSQNFLS